MIESSTPATVTLGSSSAASRAVMSWNGYCNPSSSLAKAIYGDKPARVQAFLNFGQTALLTGGWNCLCRHMARTFELEGNEPAVRERFIDAVAPPARATGDGLCLRAYNEAAESNLVMLVMLGIGLLVGIGAGLVTS